MQQRDTIHLPITLPNADEFPKILSPQDEQKVSKTISIVHHTYHHTVKVMLHYLVRYLTQYPMDHFCHTPYILLSLFSELSEKRANFHNDTISSSVTHRCRPAQFSRSGTGWYRCCHVSCQMQTDTSRGVSTRSYERPASARYEHTPREETLYVSQPANIDNAPSTYT